MFCKNCTSSNLLAFSLLYSLSLDFPLTAGVPLEPILATSATEQPYTFDSLADPDPKKVGKRRNRGTHTRREVAKIRPKTSRGGQAAEHTPTASRLQICVARPSTCPHAGVRIGEAKLPGPPLQRARALDALAHVGLAQPGWHPASCTDDAAFHDCAEEAVGGMTPPSNADTDEDEPAAAGGTPPRAVAPTLADPPTADPPPAEPACHNSWLYVPLLLHAARRLESGAAGEWLEHSEGGARWRTVSDMLAMAPPVTATALIAAVRAVAVAEGRPGNEPARALDALERLPPQGMLTLRQAVDMLADDRGYMPGIAQSAAAPHHATVTYFPPRPNTATMTKMLTWRPVQLAHRAREAGVGGAADADATHPDQAMPKCIGSSTWPCRTPRPCARRTRSRHGCATSAWKASCAAESTHCKARRGKSAAHCDRQCAPP